MRLIQGLDYFYIFISDLQLICILKVVSNSVSKNLTPHKILNIRPIQIDFRGLFLYVVEDYKHN